MGTQLLVLFPVSSVQGMPVSSRLRVFPSDDSVSLTHSPFHIEGAAAFSSDLRCLQAVS